MKEGRKMIRRIKQVLLMMLVILCASACAEEAVELPEAVLKLCEQAHPGYAVAMYDGWGNADVGQFALILSKDGDNILCMAEKAQDEAAYRLTIDNTNAVYDGDALPNMMIDTGGGSLWYTYVNREDDSSAHYGVLKTNGRWGRVNVLSYWPKEDGITGMMSWVSDGNLCYEETDEDENENIRDRWMYAPVEVSPEFAQSLELANFNINTFDDDPRDGLYPMIGNEAFAHSQTMAGYPLCDMDISTVHMAKLYEMDGGRSLLRIADWDGAFYHTAALLRFAGDAVLDTYHAGDGQVLVNSGVMMYNIERVDEGSWALYGVDDSGVRTIGPDYAAPDGQQTVYRNDGYIYGASPWDRMPREGMPITPDSAPVLAGSYEEMTAQMDESAYALVNNPNPEDRLHLRAGPDKGARSFGKFYNRTPVRVLERGETWTRVQLGRGGAAMTGYMMTKYLAFDEAEKAQIACAFPQMDLREEYRGSGLCMYAEPLGSAVTVRMFTQESNDFIIGVSGDEWYVVLRADGAVGYVPQGAFWGGNG